jgi:hypothetical protein
MNERWRLFLIRVLFWAIIVVSVVAVGAMVLAYMTTR